MVGNSTGNSTVTCKECGRTKHVDFALRSGWPSCCGYTMSLTTSAEPEAIDSAMRKVIRERLLEFIIESNTIEGIHDLDRAEDEVPAYEAFLAERVVTVEMLCSLVSAIAPHFAVKGGTLQNRLRNIEGYDVRVGNHYPPRGGEQVRYALVELLKDIQVALLSPFDAHVRYETLHPFMDGNGRSGRALWLHMMQRRQRASAGFLHQWYYDSLNAVRESRHA